MSAADSRDRRSDPLRTWARAIWRDEPVASRREWVARRAVSGLLVLLAAVAGAIPFVPLLDSPSRPAIAADERGQPELGSASEAIG